MTLSALLPRGMAQGQAAGHIDPANRLAVGYKTMLLNGVAAWASGAIGGGLHASLRALGFTAMPRPCWVKLGSGSIHVRLACVPAMAEAMHASATFGHLGLPSPCGPLTVLMSTGNTKLAFRTYMVHNMPACFHDDTIQSLLQSTLGLSVMCMRRPLFMPLLPDAMQQGVCPMLHGSSLQVTLRGPRFPRAGTQAVVLDSGERYDLHWVRLEDEHRLPPLSMQQLGDLEAGRWRASSASEIPSELPSTAKLRRAAQAAAAACSGGNSGAQQQPAAASPPAAATGRLGQAVSVSPLSSPPATLATAAPPGVAAAATAATTPVSADSKPTQAVPASGGSAPASSIMPAPMSSLPVPADHASALSAAADMDVDATPSDAPACLHASNFPALPPPGPSSVPPRKRTAQSLRSSSPQAAKKHPAAVDTMTADIEPLPPASSAPRDDHQVLRSPPMAVVAMLGSSGPAGCFESAASSESAGSTESAGPALLEALVGSSVPAAPARSEGAPGSAGQAPAPLQPHQQPQLPLPLTPSSPEAIAAGTTATPQPPNDAGAAGRDHVGGREPEEAGARQHSPPLTHQHDSVVIDTAITQFMDLMDTELAAAYRDRLNTFLHHWPGGRRTERQHSAFLRLVSLATKIHGDVRLHASHGGQAKWGRAMAYIRKLGTSHRAGFGTFSLSEFNRKLRQLHKDITTHHPAAAGTDSMAATATNNADNTNPCHTPSATIPAGAELSPCVPRASVAVHPQEVQGAGEVAGGEGRGGGVEEQRAAGGNTHGCGAPSPQPAEAEAGGTYPNPVQASTAGSNTHGYGAPSTQPAAAEAGGSYPNPVQATTASAISAPLSVAQLGASVALPSSVPPSMAADPHAVLLSAGLPAGQVPSA